MNDNLLLFLILAACATAAAFTVVSPVRTPRSSTTTAIATTAVFGTQSSPSSTSISAAVSRRLYPSSRSTTASRTALQAGLLWDRLEIEPDDEPHWYLLNCVATNELILLQQCRQVCKDMSPDDVVKFIVPTERKIRSHGANKMVTEIKVKYQGYVFAKLRLCAHVYEAIQGLDLCRSWMGTVNHKGHRKLPPAPVALSEKEIANFGLETYHEDEEEDSDEDDDENKPDANNVIVDEARVVDDDNDDVDGKKKTSKKDQDKQALKVYLGLKVDDMVKVTAKGKFFNEDGIVRRLKEGKLFVRFFTYGTMYEEWLDPGDVRKLDNMEILRGLSGPKEPVTQRDFSDPSASGDRDRDRYGSNNDRSAVRSAFVGGLEQRNRRQDRAEQRFRSTRNLDEDAGNRNDSNWNWYKDSQQQPQQQHQGLQQRQQWTDRSSPSSPSSQPEYGSRQQQHWDRPPRRQQDRSSDSRGSDNRRANQTADKAVRGEDDWSAFVSPSTSNRRSTGGAAAGAGGAGGAEDDFFQSLLNDLSDDLQKHQAAASQQSSRQPGPQQQRQERQQRQTSSVSTSSSSDSANVEDDFFASLLSEVNEKEIERSRVPPPSAPTTTRRPAPPSRQATRSSAEEDDFFASLLSQVSGDVAAASSPSSSSLPRKTSKSSNVKTEKEKYNADYADELFAELTADMPKASKQSKKDSFFDDLQADLWSNDEKTKADGAIATAATAATTTTAPAPPKSRAKASASSPVVVAPPPPPQQPRSNGSVSSSDADLSKRTVPALKELLRERGLKVSGTKSELIERIQNS
jgi:transcription antitermination factor NusG